MKSGSFSVRHKDGACLADQPGGGRRVQRADGVSGQHGGSAVAGHGTPALTTRLLPGSPRPRRVEVAAHRASEQRQVQPPPWPEGHLQRQVRARAPSSVPHLGGAGRGVNQRGRRAGVCGVGLAGGPGPAEWVWSRRALLRPDLLRAVPGKRVS